MTSRGLSVVIAYLEGIYRTTFQPNEIEAWRVELDFFDDETALRAAREYVDAGPRFPPNAGELKVIAKRLHETKRQRFATVHRLDELQALPGCSALPSRYDGESLVAWLQRVRETEAAPA